MVDYMKHILFSLVALLALSAVAQDKKFLVAEYPGGTEAMTEFFRTNFRYPQQVMDPFANARVMVKFHVEADGTISNPEIVSSSDEKFNAEALRVVSLMPRWVPASSNGKPVPMDYTVPLTLSQYAPSRGVDAALERAMMSPGQRPNRGLWHFVNYPAGHYYNLFSEEADLNIWMEPVKADGSFDFKLRMNRANVPKLVYEQRGDTLVKYWFNDYLSNSHKKGWNVDHAVRMEPGKETKMPTDIYRLIEGLQGFIEEDDDPRAGVWGLLSYTMKSHKEMVRSTQAPEGDFLAVRFYKHDYQVISFDNGLRQFLNIYDDIYRHEMSGKLRTLTPTSNGYIDHGVRHKLKFDKSGNTMYDHVVVEDAVYDYVWKRIPCPAVIKNLLLY